MPDGRDLRFPRPFRLYSLPNFVKTPLILATRKSPLAMRQTELARDFIEGACEGVTCELLPMSTQGDTQVAWSLENKGGKGLFTKELEVALLDGRADLAIHSAKDLPTEEVEGLILAGYLPREDPGDVFVVREDCRKVREIATSSPRRRAQAKRVHPQVCWSEIRGNVQTRLKKIAHGSADATILAAAGLKRLGIEDFPGLRFEPLPPDEMIPAAGQGAIAVQCRADELETYRPLFCPETRHAVAIERGMLARLGGGCHTAVGVHFSAGHLHLFHEDKGAHTFPLEAKGEAEIEDALEAIFQKVFGS